VKVRNIKALVPFKGYVVRSLTFEKVGAQINLEFDKRSGPRCPRCDQRLARNKLTRRVVYDNPMPHGALTLLTFPTAQALCKRCNHYVTSCPKEVHPTCKATYRFMRQISSWASVATADDVAAMFEISPSSVRRYDKMAPKDGAEAWYYGNVKALQLDMEAIIAIRVLGGEIDATNESDEELLKRILSGNFVRVDVFRVLIQQP